MMVFCYFKVSQFLPGEYPAGNFLGGRLAPLKGVQKRVSKGYMDVVLVFFVSNTEKRRPTN